MKWIVCALFLAAASVPAGADAKPAIKSVLPFGVRAGRTTTVLVYGDNLAPKSASFTRSPAAVKLIDTKPTDDKTKSKGAVVVTLQVSAPESCPAENYELALVQADGSKVTAAISIVEDASEEAQIKKPASTYAGAMPITSKSEAVTGTLDGDTGDVFRFEARTSETWVLSLLGGRAGSQIDPVLRIRDDRHITLLLSAGAKNRDRAITFHPPSDGTYFIDITDAEARGGPGYDYRLTVRCR